MSRLRFDRQRDFGVRGQFFRQFFGLLLRAFKVFGGGFGGRVRDFGCFRLQRLNPHCFRFRFNRFDFRFYGLSFDGVLRGFDGDGFDLFGGDFSLPFGFVLRCFPFDDGIGDGLFRRLNGDGRFLLFRGLNGLLFDLFGGAFGLQRRGFGLFGNLGRQNVRRFIGRALFNWGGIVGFDWGKRFRQLGIGFRFCLRAVGRAVVQVLMRAVLNGYSRTR